MSTRRKKRDLRTQSELAEMLGVDRRQLGMWATRSDRNGFPEPVRTVERYGRTVKVYDAADVSRWHQTYVPSVGGRPRAVAS